MAFSTVSLFLDKFKHLLRSDAALKDAIQTSIKNRFNIEIPRKDISVKEGAAHITCTPALKSRLYMERQALLEEINKTLGGSLKDIR